MIFKFIKGTTNYLSVFILLLFLCSSNNLVQAQKLLNSCNLNNPDSIALAKCLLRPVKRGAVLGNIPDNLPTPLNQRIGKKTNISIKTLENYLNGNGIKESEIGGKISKSFNKTRFFVIHDTNTNLAHQDFPTGKKDNGTFEQIINTSQWKFNRLDFWQSQNIPTHVFVNRLGDSITKYDFSNQQVRATKYELAKLSGVSCSKRPDLCEPNWQSLVKERSRLFVHIELIQPRHCLVLKPGCKNDLIAPLPGFTEKQLRRLAILYIVASVRRGIWLIPAFHAAIDAGRKDGHDDPQNFAMDVWTNELNKLIKQIKKVQ